MTSDGLIAKISYVRYKITETKTASNNANLKQEN